VSTQDSQAHVTVGVTVWLLHWWRGPEHRIEPFHSHESALHCLATWAHDLWGDASWRDGVPEDPRTLTDSEVVSWYYAGTGDVPQPTSGETDEDGFVITETKVRGPEPAELHLRLASLRVLDPDPDDSTAAPLTYCMDAIGVTVAVYEDRNGLVVHITGDDLSTRTQVRVSVDGRSTTQTEYIHVLD
jgi:hypothetical protein